VRNATPHAPGFGLEGVSAISAADVWAVGQTYSDNTAWHPARSVIEHWNGRHWSLVRFHHPRWDIDAVSAVNPDSP
jgi:hypothetical protein